MQSDRRFLNATGAAPFRAQLYLCMLAQALQVKGQIEELRSLNVLGMLTWQLNEIWPTVSGAHFQKVKM